MSTKRSTVNLVLSALTCALTFHAGAGTAATLNLARTPLFLGELVTPNVFFEVDDSGSMDWETLTTQYWYYNNYWRSTGETRVTSGRWRTYAGQGNCTGRRDYGYMFRTGDNAYNSCNYAELERNPEGGVRDWRGRSASLNVVYYNPDLEYDPWAGEDANGNPFTDANFGAARSNPQPGSDGYGRTRNLDGFVYEVWEDSHGFSGGFPTGPASATVGANGVVDLWDNHTRYTISGGNVIKEVFTHDPDPSRTCNLTDANRNPPYRDCFRTQVATSTIGGAAAADIRQNVANWYQYYRRRSFVAKAAITGVVQGTPDYRYGLSLINRWSGSSGVFVEVPDETDPSFVDYPTHNEGMLSDFLSYRWTSNGTPLRTALKRTGDYFDDNLSGKRDPITHECQQNFAVLFTDGYWNGGSPSVGNEDADALSNSLADVAKRYYDRDLSPLPNEVPTNSFDAANWQHLVTFGVAFGVQGNLVDNDGDGWPDTDAGGAAGASWPSESGDWGDPFSGALDRIDDLWHAAYNSRGAFLSAKNPEELVQGLKDILANIGARLASASSLALNSGAVANNSRLYQARFTSGDWVGQLLSFRIDFTGARVFPEEWEAGRALTNQTIDWNTDRDILTYKPSENRGVPFVWPSNPAAPTATEIDVSQSQALSIDPTTGTADGRGEERLEYLRGRNNISDFRARLNLLGDIVHSSPALIGPPNNIYPNLWDDLTITSDDNGSAPENAVPFIEWRQDPARLRRPRVIYAGANDGMLHGFNAGTYQPASQSFNGGDGNEVIAYVPSGVYPRLNRLTDPDYRHQYYVDSTVTFMDAFYGGDWHTVLLGGLGGGGQSIYALDVTDPTLFGEARAQDTVLWEFGDRDDPTTPRVDGDPDMGFGYYQPANVMRMHDGRWYAVFGNGYDNTENDGSVSATGNAVLYILDLETGNLVRKIDTGKGMIDDPKGANMPNGLSTVAGVDGDGDFVVDLLYAGDLYGNLWKFDVGDPDPLNWEIPFVDLNGDPAPLFTAIAPNGNAQPITERPVIGRRVHPDQTSGSMVYFGTGKYFEVGDNVPTGQDTQTFYGIWDKNLASNHGDYSPPPYDRSHLLAQSILSEPLANGSTWRLQTNNPMVWRAGGGLPGSPASDYLGWRLDLIDTTLNDNLGERSITDPLLRGRRVIFTTLVPSQNPCDFGGTGWLMELDVGSGGHLPFSPFDVNGDFGFSADDFLSGTPVSGVKSEGGIPSAPAIMVVPDYDVTGVFQGGGGGGGGGGGVVVPPESCPPGECKKIQNTSGAVDTQHEKEEGEGRQTWRQIR